MTSKYSFTSTLFHTLHFASRRPSSDIRVCVQ